MISDTWRYYKNETSMDINFSLDLYPYEGETIDEVKMVFIPYTEFNSGYEMPEPEELYKNNSYYSYNRNYNIFKTISYANNCKWSKQK